MLRRVSPARREDGKLKRDGTSRSSALNAAQSELSRHIKQLEHELGGELLERGARGVSVTESGKVLLARGRWLLGAVDDVKAAAQP
ncbi:MAG: LysR family transcriptional regulator, partial [Bradyrhizobium sp.]